MKSLALLLFCAPLWCIAGERICSVRVDRSCDVQDVRLLSELENGRTVFRRVDVLCRGGELHVFTNDELRPQFGWWLSQMPTAVKVEQDRAQGARIQCFEERQQAGR